MLAEVTKAAKENDKLLAKISEERQAMVKAAKEQASAHRAAVKAVEDVAADQLKLHNERTAFETDRTAKETYLRGLKTEVENKLNEANKKLSEAEALAKANAAKADKLAKAEAALKTREDALRSALAA